MKCRDLVRELEADGWKALRRHGSHSVYRHSTKPGVVIVAGKPGKDVPPGTLGTILKQARLKP